MVDITQPTAPALFYNITMTCGGCSGAIDRVLKKNILPPNVYRVELEKQRAVVWGPQLPDIDQVTAKLAKTGKTINSSELVTDDAKLQSLLA